MSLNYLYFCYISKKKQSPKALQSVNKLQTSLTGKTLSFGLWSLIWCLEYNTHNPVIMWMLALLLTARQNALQVEQILLGQQYNASEIIYQQSTLTRPAVFILCAKYWIAFYMLYFPSNSMDTDRIKCVVLKHYQHKKCR